MDSGDYQVDNPQAMPIEPMLLRGSEIVQKEEKKLTRNST